jgi:preprotein translocase subunit SecE
VSDEGNAADGPALAASDGGEAEDSRSGGGRTAVVTKPAVRPQRPTGKRSRQRMLEAGEDLENKESPEATSDEGAESDGGKAAKEHSGAKKAKKGRKSEGTGSGPAGRKASKSGPKSGKAKKQKKAGDRSANPIVFVYNYLKQVVAEMRKVIWPNRKQMLTYTSVVLVFLAFMVALVGLTDFGLTKLVLLVFG